MLGVAVGLVYLVDYHNGSQAHFKGFLKYKAGLGHRSLKGVDQKQNAVGHVQDSLHLSTKVSVTRRIDNVDFNALVVYTHVLGQNRNSTLSF